jgi:predicted nucleic acid-binding protein
MPVQSIRTVRSFLDTNLLLYCDDQNQPEKQRKALELILQHRKQGTGVVSIQVLQEYYVNAVRKYGTDAETARKKVEIYSRFEVVEPNTSDVLAAIDLHRMKMLSFWDAMILHSARKADCRVLLSEDLQHGQQFDGLRIVNPFL